MSMPEAAGSPQSLRLYQVRFPNDFRLVQPEAGLADPSHEQPRSPISTQEK